MRRGYAFAYIVEMLMLGPVLQEERTGSGACCDCATGRDRGTMTHADGVTSVPPVRKFARLEREARRS